MSMDKRYQLEVKISQSIVAKAYDYHDYDSVHIFSTFDDDKLLVICLSVGDWWSDHDMWEYTISTDEMRLTHQGMGGDYALDVLEGLHGHWRTVARLFVDEEE